MNSEILDDFREETIKACENLEKIKKHLSYQGVHNNNIDYGDVGNMVHVNEQLSNIMEFLGVYN